MISSPRRLLTMFLLTAAVFCVPVAAVGQERVRITLVSDEAEAVLAALDKMAEGRELDASDLSSVFGSEGYKRLKAREHSLGRSFEESDFKAFLYSDVLGQRRNALRRLLEEWKETDFSKLGSRVLKYLPDSAVIRAKVYPVIKPATNSFVFDLANDPAIFLYLDEYLSKEAFGNTVAHELHHIGFGTACPPKSDAAVAEPTEPKGKVLRWLGAFGEGFAMLAAAGGYKKHPHLTSSEKDRARWDRDAANFDADLKKVESFFLELLAGKLTQEAELGQARSFYGIQGPWYTVGWKMAAIIEEELGRDTLIECFCDSRKLLKTFNSAAQMHSKRTGEKVALWNEKLVGEVSGEKD